MTPHQKAQPPIAAVENFLASHFGARPEQLAPIRGGFWSSAYTFEVNGEALVLRLSDAAEGFHIDRLAFAFAGPELPVPEVIEIGTALDLHYAISRRHYGRFLEEVAVSDAPEAGAALTTLLTALRSVPAQPEQAVDWYAPGVSSDKSWHDWLRAGLIDSPDSRTHGWRKTIAADHRLDQIFKRCETTIDDLLPLCPERRDLVHGDLLHQNVLVNADASAVTAVFSWKCSVRGDFLFDVAWCTFWDAWHPGIAATEIWARTLGDNALNSEQLLNAPQRHHAYELQIAASHLAWTAWTEDDRELNAVAERAEFVLERGPLPAPK